MLEFLQIKNFALIKSLSLNFSQGCHIFTGETGAGKSILLNSIKAILAHKVSNNIVHPQAEIAEVNASFSFRDSVNIAKKISLILHSIDLDWSENESLIIKRIWGKRNMVFINDNLSSLKILKQLSELIIDYFSPGDQFHLLESEKQKEIVDRFAQHKDLLEKVATVYENWQIAQQKLNEFKQKSLTEQEFERLNTQIKDLNFLNIQENEDEILSKEYNQVYYAQELLQNSQCAQKILSNDETGIKQMLFKLQEILKVLEEKDYENTKNIRDLLQNISINVNELSFEIDGYSSGLFIDEEKIHKLNQRMTEINDAKRKYGPSLAEVFAYHQDILKKFHQYESKEKYQQNLEKKLREEENKYKQFAQKLSQSRKKSAEKIQYLVNQQFKDLSLDDAIFSIKISESAPNITGIDCIEFEFSSHKTLPLSPIREQVSSGEIMRIVLALKVISLEYEQVPVIIFDEIDSNIGGVTANKIAQKFNYLAKDCQLFCISHSAPIASCARYHYKILKKSTKDTVETIVMELDKEQRIEEITRMLGGKELSNVSRQHAQELIDKLSK